MVCNLAVAITKAAVTDERLQALVDSQHDQVMLALARFLERRHPHLSVSPPAHLTGTIRVNACSVSLVRGQVKVAGQRGSEDLMDVLSRQATEFLAAASDRLFAQAVGRALARCATITGMQTSTVDNQGTAQQATVYTLRLGTLQARVFVLPGGRVQIFIDTGSFPEARAATERLLDTMEAESVGLQMTGEIEQHRDGADHVHVQQQQKGTR
jgi:hypothetical protein